MKINEERRLGLKINKQEVHMKKALIKPNFVNKTVLTDSTWGYIELLLKQNNDEKNKEALNYWVQARNFYEATRHLDALSKPLTIYYCLLNATKALLTYKNIGFSTKHGVSGKVANGNLNLKNELVYIHPRGVLSGLCDYLGERVTSSTEYNLKDILYNLEYIHRAYTLTFSNQTELFIPISTPRFVFDKTRKKGWLEVTLEEGFSNKQEFTKIKKGFSIDKYYDNSKSYTIRLNKTFDWEAPYNRPTVKSLMSLEKYYERNRKRFRYIYSPNQLWYVKRSDLQGIIDKNSLILTFAAMHRLSEMSRYDPNRLSKLLQGKSGWLLMEFVDKSIYQFIDSISSEISGDDFRVTGFRT